MHLEQNNKQNKNFDEKAASQEIFLRGKIQSAQQQTNG